MTEKKATTRRDFFLGLLAGAGALAVAGGAKEAQASQKAGLGQIPDPILFKRSEESDRYYKTLYT